MIIAGELSGDLHGASLISELKKLQPSLNICGIGGDRMIKAGMSADYHINKMAFLGFVEVIKHLSFIKKVQNELLDIIEKKNIKTVVLIDYPGFNINFAKKLKKLNRKIIYYISPQIWAWGKNRIKTIKRLINKMLVIFPFEENIYKKENVDTLYVGHPLVERLNGYVYLSKEKLISEYGLDPMKEILFIMPGSRMQEVEKIFPETIRAAVTLAEKYNLQIVVSCASTIDEEIFHGISKERNFKIVKNNIYDFMKHSKLGIIKSGTSTLEAALNGLPMIIVYKTNLLTYLIGKNLSDLAVIGMVNILADEKIAPELIQDDVNAVKILTECEKILNDENAGFKIRQKLSTLKEKLGTKPASKNAAQIIFSMLNVN
jgi:lipid-A-disaccharide synthase